MHSCRCVCLHVNTRAEAREHIPYNGLSIVMPQVPSASLETGFLIGWEASPRDLLLIASPALGLQLFTTNLVFSCGDGLQAPVLARGVAYCLGHSPAPPAVLSRLVSGKSYKGRLTV